MTESEQLRIWFDNILKGMKLRKEGNWTELDYQKNMYKLAVEFNLPSTDILEYEMEIKILKEKNEHWCKLIRVNCSVCYGSNSNVYK